MAQIVAPAVIRGEVITDNLVSFGGRGGEMEFLSPDPDSIIDRLPLRNPAEMRKLYTLSIDDIIDYLVELGQQLDLAKSEFLQEALEQSYAATDLTPSILRWQYSLIQHFFSRDMVRGYIDVPIGIPFVEGWQKVKLADGREASIRAMGARCLHITAGNSPITAIITLARNALTRSDAIIKSPSNDPFTAVAVARTMIAMAPDHPLTKHFSVAYWKGGSVEFEERLYQPRNIEKIIAWGGFASVKHVTRYIQPGLELISLDPKRSATIIGRDTFADEATMRDAALRAATDIGASNQTGCSSARVILVESGTDDDGIALLRRFGEMIYAAMMGLPDDVSNKPKNVDAELRADIQGLRSTPDFYDVIGGKDDEGAIIISKLDDVVDFYPRLSGRVANLVPIDDVSEASRFMSSYTQTVGVYPEALKLKLRDELPLYGAQRIVTLGYAMTSNPALPQDAIEPVRRMVKWIVDENCPVEECPPLWAVQAPSPSEPGIHLKSREAIMSTVTETEAKPVPLEELDLYHLPWNTPEMAADPYTEIEAARAKHPWLAKADEGYVVIGYQAIRDLMEMDHQDKMRPSFDGIIEILGAKDTPWGRFTSEQMLAMPAADHRVLRDAFAAKFTPRYANGIRPLMRDIMGKLLDEWLPKGRFDFAEFSSYYPVSVMTSMIGAPLEVIPGLRESLEALGLAYSLDPSREPGLQKAIIHMDDFCQKLVAERRENPEHDGPPDLLDMLIEASSEGQIPDRQLIDMLIFLFEAGYDTSKNVITFMMYEMTRHPEIYRKCGEDIDYCRKAVEEFLRFFNPSHSFRFTDTEIVYDGVILPKDTMLFFSLNQSGRDPSVFENPEVFDPERPIDPRHRQLAFGLGKHMCLGQYIARAQIQEGLHMIAQRMKNPRIAGEVKFRPFPGLWGLESLPLEFDVA